MRRTLTIAQVAEILQVKPNTVRTWIKKGRLPGIRIGHVFRVPEAELDRILGTEPEPMPVGEPSEGPDLTEEEIMALFAHGPGLKKEREPVETRPGEENISELGRRLRRRRERIVASGVKLLDWDEIEQEVRERRGGAERLADETDLR